MAKTIPQTLQRESHTDVQGDGRGHGPGDLRSTLIWSKLRLLASNEEFANEMEVAYKAVQMKIRSGCKNQADFSELPKIAKRLEWYEEKKGVARTLSMQARAARAGAKAKGKAKARPKGMPVKSAMKAKASKKPKT